MKDLFVLTDDGEHGSTETSSIFSQLAEDVNVVGNHKDSEHDAKLNKPTAFSASIASTENGHDSTIKSSKKGKERAENSGKETDVESNILQSLFDAHGIHVSFFYIHDTSDMRFMCSFFLVDLFYELVKLKTKIKQYALYNFWFYSSKQI